LMPLKHTKGSTIIADISKVKNIGDNRDRVSLDSEMLDDRSFAQDINNNIANRRHPKISISNFHSRVLIKHHPPQDKGDRCRRASQYQLADKRIN
jgi:hypothetical protein